MNVIDVLKYGHQTVMRTVESFPGHGWNTPGAVGTWSARDVLAHLTSFEWVLVDVLGQILDPTVETPALDSYLATDPVFNDDQVARRSDRSLSEVLAEYDSAHAQAMACAVKVSPETWEQEGSLPWYGAEYDLEDLITYQYYGHKREHCGQIAVFGDRFRQPAES